MTNIKLHRDDDLPQEALDNCANVLDMLYCFLASAGDLHIFQRNPGNTDPISGLCTVIDACRNTVDATSQRFMTETSDNESLNNIAAELSAEAYEDESQRQAWRFGFAAGAMYRDATSPNAEDENNTMPLLKTGSDFETENVAISKNAASGDLTYPRLSARDHAIASAVKEGYDLPEVAKAVNLKRATVEKIVAQLRNDGVLPQEDQQSTAAPKAASA